MLDFTPEEMKQYLISKKYKIYENVAVLNENEYQVEEAFNKELKKTILSENKPPILLIAYIGIASIKDQTVIREMFHDVNKTLNSYQYNYPITIITIPEPTSNKIKLECINPTQISEKEYIDIKSNIQTLIKECDSKYIELFLFK